MKVPVLNKYKNSKETFVERRLPAVGTLFVNKGDEINSYDQIGQTNFIKDSEKVEYKGKAVKDIGDRVYSGDVVAVNKKYIVKKEEFTASISGRIKDINEKENIISIEGLSRRFNLISGVSGEVIDVLKNKSVLIKTQALQIKGVGGCGEEVGGELFYIEGKKEVVTEKEITQDVAGKILLLNKVENAAIRKAKTLGAEGFVIGSCDYIDFKKFNEEGISLLLLEGFGTISINNHILDYFKGFKSKFGIIKTFDSMLVVPGSDTLSFNTVPGDSFEVEVSLGDVVQVFNADYYGAIMEIKELDEKENLVIGNVEDEVIKVPADQVGLLD